MMGTATLAPVKEERTDKKKRRSYEERKNVLLKRNLQLIDRAYKSLSLGEEEQKKEKGKEFLARRFALGEEEEKVKIRGYLSKLLKDDPATCETIINKAKEIKHSKKSKTENSSYRKYLDKPDWADFRK